MTVRAKPIRKREEVARLSINVERAAAGLLQPFFILPEMKTRSFWRMIASTHGKAIDSRVAELLPGTRPGYRYALGEFPPVPLIDRPFRDDRAAHNCIDIDGDRFWHAGYPWQESQAEHLRRIGEVDGREWRRYVAWRDTGFERRYVFTDDRGRGPSGVFHGCY